MSWAGVFLVVNLVNAMHKGGDFDVYVEAARGLVTGTPLYEQSGIAAGFVGPPAQAVPFVVFVPLASADPTAAPLAWYGVSVVLLWYSLMTWAHWLRGVSAWRAIAGEGWPARRANQSMLAMWGRYLAGEGAAGYSNVTPEDVVVIACTVMMSATMLVPFLVAASRPASRHRIGEELGCVSALAVLFAPIAWEHYWVAWCPVLMALHRHVPSDGSRWARWSFWAGALLFSGCSRPTVGGTAARVVRSWSFMTWGAIITCATLTPLLLTAGEGFGHERDSN